MLSPPGLVAHMCGVTSGLPPSDSSLICTMDFTLNCLLPKNAVVLDDEMGFRANPDDYYRKPN
jgi:hypothetical protein